MCACVCVYGGWTVLIELVSDDSEESHKKKEGMPKGSTGISFTLTSLSLSLPLSPLTFFWISALFFHSPLDSIEAVLQKYCTSPKDFPLPKHTHTNLSIDRPTQTICCSVVLYEQHNLFLSSKMLSVREVLGK